MKKAFCHEISDYRSHETTARSQGFPIAIIKSSPSILPETKSRNETCAIGEKQNDLVFSLRSMPILLASKPDGKRNVPFYSCPQRLTKTKLGAGALSIQQIKEHESIRGKRQHFTSHEELHRKVNRIYLLSQQARCRKLIGEKFLNFLPLTRMVRLPNSFIRPPSFEARNHQVISLNFTFLQNSPPFSQ